MHQALNHEIAGEISKCPKRVTNVVRCSHQTTASAAHVVRRSFPTRHQPHRKGGQQRSTSAQQSIAGDILWFFIFAIAAQASADLIAITIYPYGESFWPVFVVATLIIVAAMHALKARFIDHRSEIETDIFTWLPRLACVCIAIFMNYAFGNYFSAIGDFLDQTIDYETRMVFFEYDVSSALVAAAVFAVWLMVSPRRAG